MKRARAIEVLQALRPHLEARGIAHAGVFGSVGRDGASVSSDVDIVVTPAAARGLDLIDLGAIQTMLEERFEGVEVDLVVEPVRRPELKAALKRDRVDAF